MEEIVRAKGRSLKQGEGVGLGTEVIGVGDRRNWWRTWEWLVVTDRKKEESAWPESSATEDSRLPPVNPTWRLYWGRTGGAANQLQRQSWTKLGEHMWGTRWEEQCRRRIWHPPTDRGFWTSWGQTAIEHPCLRQQWQAKVWHYYNCI